MQVTIEDVCEQFNVPVPKPGDKIYVHGSAFIGHGEDDVDGGLATIRQVEFNYIKQRPVNSIMVVFEEIVGHAYNYLGLMEKQEELSQRLNNQVAKNAPDYNSYGDHW